MNKDEKLAVANGILVGIGIIAIFAVVHLIFFFLTGHLS